jgi:hypothetical protein
MQRLGLDPPRAATRSGRPGRTAYLQNGGTFEKAQQIANHESPRTTKLYDRSNDTLTLGRWTKSNVSRCKRDVATSAHDPFVRAVRARIGPPHGRGRGRVFASPRPGDREGRRCGPL